LGAGFKAQGVAGKDIFSEQWRLAGKARSGSPIAQLGDDFIEFLLILLGPKCHENQLTPEIRLRKGHGQRSYLSLGYFILTSALPPLV
jgi:hypothetical protein